MSSRSPSRDSKSHKNTKGQRPWEDSWQNASTSNSNHSQFYSLNITNLPSNVTAIDLKKEFQEVLYQTINY